MLMVVLCLLKQFVICDNNFRPPLTAKRQDKISAFFEVRASRDWCVPVNDGFTPFLPIKSKSPVYPLVDKGEQETK